MNPEIEGGGVVYIVIIGHTTLHNLWNSRVWLMHYSFLWNSLLLLEWFGVFTVLSISFIIVAIWKIMLKHYKAQSFVMFIRTFPW